MTRILSRSPKKPINKPISVNPSWKFPKDQKKSRFFKKKIKIQRISKDPRGEVNLTVSWNHSDADENSGHETRTPVQELPINNKFYYQGPNMLHFCNITKCLKLARVLQSVSHSASQASRFGSTITNHPLNVILPSYNLGHWSRTAETQRVNGSAEPVPVPGKTRSTHLPDHESGIWILWWSPFLLWPIHTEHTHNRSDGHRGVFQRQLFPLGSTLSNAVNGLLCKSNL